MRMRRKHTRRLWRAEDDALLLTLTNPAAAAHFGITLSAAANRRLCLRKRLGSVARAPRVGPDGLTAAQRWSGVDWSQGDDAIARRLGLTKDRVREVRVERQRAGLPAGKPVKITATPHVWTREEDALFATLSNVAIAQRLGITPTCARQHRYRLRVAGRL